MCPILEAGICQVGQLLLTKQVRSMFNGILMLNMQQKMAMLFIRALWPCLKKPTPFCVLMVKSDMKAVEELCQWQLSVTQPNQCTLVKPGRMPLKQKMAQRTNLSGSPVHLFTILHLGIQCTSRVPYLSVWQESTPSVLYCSCTVLFLQLLWVGCSFPADVGGPL